MNALTVLEYASIEPILASLSDELRKLDRRELSGHHPPLPEPIEDVPAHAQQLRTKALSALNEGRYEEALSTFVTLGTLDGVEGASYLSNLGIHLAWSRQREYPKALEVLEEALGMGDDRPVLLGIGTTLHQMESYPEALETFEDVKARWPDDPDVWVYQMAPLSSLERGQEALGSAEQAFPLRHEASDPGSLLYVGAALASLGLGLSALKRRWLPGLEAATRAFIKWRDRARRDKQTDAFKQAVGEVKQGLTEEDMDTLDEFMLGVRLASIRDPFKRWDAIAEEINKVWPEGKSAVDAIREQRE